MKKRHLISPRSNVYQDLQHEVWSTLGNTWMQQLGHESTHGVVLPFPAKVLRQEDQNLKMNQKFNDINQI